MAFAAVLSDRKVLRVAGEDAAHFLHNLVTSSVERLAPGDAAYGALLTPQGKIISDFLVFRTGDAFLLDCPAARVEDLRKRLTMYRLRAKVEFADEDIVVAAIWGGTPPDLPSLFADPRLPALGARALLPRGRADEILSGSGLDVKPEADFHAQRIALGVPEGGRDFAFDDTFPHEADMDQLGGVDFRKGCYIGQEVVSRMQHRATARTRIVPVLVAGRTEPDAEITAGDRTIGRLGSLSDGRGLAMMRIDRADDALAAGEPLKAGDAVLTIRKPDWARFRFPGEPAPETAS